MSFTWDELDQLGSQGKWRYPLPPTCPKCAYILTGLPGKRCPECGTQFAWKEVRRRTAWICTLVRRVEHADRDAKMGITLGLIGWSVLIISRLVWWQALGLPASIIALVCSLMAVVLGSQVLNLRRVPAWARQYMVIPTPRKTLGYGAMGLGLALAAGFVLMP